MSRLIPITVPQHPNTSNITFPIPKYKEIPMMIGARNNDRKKKISKADNEPAQ